MVVNTKETQVMHSITLVFGSSGDLKRFLKYAGIPQEGAENGVLMVKLTDDTTQAKLEIEENEREGGD